MMPQINIPLLFLSAILMYILRSYEISKANSSIVPTSRADIIPSVLVSFKLTAILTLSRLGLAFFFFFGDVETPQIAQGTKFVFVRYRVLQRP